MRVSIIFFLSLIFCSHSKQDPPIDSITCSTDYDSINPNVYRNATFLTKVDTTIIEVISPLSLLASIIVITLYIKVPATRQQPGDIILALAVSEIFLVFGYLSTVIYNSYNPWNPKQLPEHFNALCNSTGYLIVLSFCAEFIYNVSFCIFFIVIVKNVFKSGWQKQKWIVHIICPIILLIVALVLWLTGEIGISLFGVCAIRLSSYSPFFRSILIFTYTIGLILSTVYFRRRIPQFELNTSKRATFMKYNYRYIYCIAVNLILQTTCDLVAAISCQRTHIVSNVIGISVTLSNTFTLATPIIICLVMFSHPEVRASIHAALIRWFGEKRVGQRDSLSGEGGMIEMKLIESPTGLLTTILSITKSRLIYSILCAIVIEDRQVTGLSSLRQTNEWNFKDKMIIKMNLNMIKQFEDLKLQDLEVLDVEITSYCPRVFKTLMKIDGFNSLAPYLSPKFNKESIQKLSQATGGRSGQFFFFSYDNQIILKTLSKKQLDVLLVRIQAMVQYYEKNPNSLITKVYGVYSLTSKQTGEQYHIFVMKNLSGCDRKYISRMYDLKGSKLDRQVLKDYDGVSQSVSTTLKDIDFEELERRLEIDPEQAQALKQILIEDSTFLKDNKLIDYSLIVMKMKLEDYLKDNQMLFDQFKSKQVNPYAIIRSNIDKSEAYVIGIIDYLETWNVKKKSEKITKILLFFKFKSTEDVSAQAPDQYSDRFIQKVVKKILDK